MDAKQNAARATIQFAMSDAHDSLVAAVRDNRWLDVSKYAAQIDSGRAEHARLGFGTINFHGNGTLENA